VIEQALGREGLEAAIRQSAYFPDEARAVPSGSTRQFSS
jgi:hypothetical protein